MASPPSRHRRGMVVVEAVREATIEVLAQIGYAAMTIEAVALRAGVNKTTVYRRWPSKTELVHDALQHRFLEQFKTSNAGSLREDLFALLQHTRDFLLSPLGQALLRVFSADGLDSEAAHIAHSLDQEGAQQHISIFERAVKRGELPRGLPLQTLLNTLKATMVNCIVFQQQNEVPDAFLWQMIDMLLDGALNGGGLRHLPSTEAQSPTG